MDTSELILLIRNRNLYSKAADIARIVGVSREYVRQILKKNGLATNFRTYLKIHCADCGTDLAGKTQSGLCRECKKIETIKRNTATCSWCGIQFHAVDMAARRKRNTSGFMFHDKHCYGKWAGKHYGFCTEKNKGQEVGLRMRISRGKVNSSIVWSTHLTTGFGALRLSRLIRIPKGTVAGYLREKRREQNESR